MKNMFFAAMLLMAGFLASCSSDDDAAPAPQPSFELNEVGAYDLAELDEKDFITTPVEFVTTAAVWHLSSDKMWVLFSTEEDGVYYNDIMGAAGSHKVYMKITNEARTFESSDAKVKFTYDDTYEYLLPIISRPAKGYDCSIFDENGEKIESVDIDGSGSTKVIIDANYTYGIKSYPDWIQEPEISDGGFLLSIKEDYTPYVLNGEIVIAGTAGEVEQVVPVNYLGMLPDRIMISGDYTPWGWEISLDGKTFLVEGNSLDGETEETIVEEALPFGVKCLNYDCKYVFARENADGSITYMPEGWLYAEQNEVVKSEVLVKAKSFTATAEARSRKGYLFAVPAGVYDDFMQQLTAATSAVDFVDENINYVLVEATQRDIFAVDGFVVTTSSGEAVTCEPEPAGDFYDWVSSELSITDVFAFDGVNGTTYTINTLYTDSDWGGGYALYSKSVSSISTRTWKFSRTKNDEGYYIFTLTVPAAEKFTEPVIIRLHTDNVNKKALIIKPVNN